MAYTRFFLQKILLLLICLSGFALTTFAQQPWPPAKLSAGTKMYLWQQEKLGKGKPVILPDNVYKMDAQQVIYLSTLVKVYPGFNDAPLRAIGATIGTRAGNVWTVRVPLEQFEAFISINGIEYIETDQPAAPFLDTARRLTRADSVHAGIWLPQAYSGKNVVVGVIDAGFDYTHPTFYDTSYTHYRVRRVWEEKNTTGPAPANYNYGTEYTDSLSMHIRGQDITGGTHGTHVAGIAGGSGAGGPSGNSARYRGMAYESDLVFVGIYPTSAYWLNTGMSDMLDGISYVYDYAASVSKPAVANLSWGCPLGPRDGSSLFSQACNALAGPGKVFVLSGGNNGTNRIHLQKTFTPTDTVVNTFTSFSTSLPEKKNWVDIWGDTAKTFCVNFTLYQGTNKIDSSAVICLDNQTHQFHLIGSNGDTCFITATTVSSEFNLRPHVLIQFYSRVNDRVGITVTGNDGVINMWQGIVVATSGYYGTFLNYGQQWAVNGDLVSTTGDLVSTSSAIAVAAYNSKPSFINVSNVPLSYSGYPKGAIASFSSRGPTADGRTKPNIAGPGMALASAVSSVDSSFLSTGPSYSSVVSNFVSPLNNRTYSYAMLAGTSMASPAVAGIVAMLLEADPTLSPTQVMNILYQTAIQDSHTGVIPPNGSNTWGFGKVNAYRAMVQVLGLTGVQHQQNPVLSCLVYPNPVEGNYTVAYTAGQAETMQLKLVDLAGRVVRSQNWPVQAGENKLQLETTGLPAGTYFTVLSGTSGTGTVKIVKY